MVYEYIFLKTIEIGVVQIHIVLHALKKIKLLNIIEIHWPRLLLEKKVVNPLFPIQPLVRCLFHTHYIYSFSGYICVSLVANVCVILND